MPAAPPPPSHARAGSAPPEAAGTSLRIQLAVLVAVIGPLIVLCQVISYWRTDVVDDQMFGYYGWRIAHGAVVYRDVWDNKPPGIYWINALGFRIGADHYLGVVVLCGVALAVAHAAFFVAAASVYRRGAAAVTTLLLALYLMHAYFTGGSNRTETFLVAAELTGVALYLRGWARGGGWWRWLLAGAACGTAFLFKQVGLAAWGCMGLHLLICAARRQLPWSAALGRGLLLAVGAALPVGTAGLVLWSQGVLADALFATFGFNRAYFAAGASQFPFNYANYMLLREHIFPTLQLPILMALVSAIHGGLWWWRPRYRPPEIETQVQVTGGHCPGHLLFFGLWLLVATYGALMSPHAFRHYIVPAIPPLLLVAGYLVNVLRAELSLLRRVQQRAWVACACVVMAYFSVEAFRTQFSEMAKVWVYRIEGHEPAEWEVVGDAVAALTGPADRMQAWGYLPGAYLRARRVNACRFTTTEKVGQVHRGARFVVEEIESTLRAAPPAVLVLSHKDYTWMTEADESGQPSDFQLGPWIDAHYRRVVEIPRFGTYYVFLRNDLAAAREPRG